MKIICPACGRAGKVLKVGRKTQGLPDDSIEQGEFQHGPGESSGPVYGRIQTTACRPKLRRDGIAIAKNADHVTQTNCADHEIRIRGLWTIQGQLSIKKAFIFF